MHACEQLKMALCPPCAHGMCEACAAQSTPEHPLCTDGGGPMAKPEWHTKADQVGADVHYVAYGTPGGEYPKTCRAAKITQVGEGWERGVIVFNPTGLFFHPSLMADFTEAQGGTWHHADECCGHA